MQIPQRALKIAVVQNDAGGDVEGNLKRIEKLISGSKTADIIALPEVFALRGSDDDYRVHAQSLQGYIVQWLKQLAIAHHAWVLAGSIIEKSGSKFFNTCLLLDRRGRIAAKYRKIHLFEAHLGGGKSVRESDIYSAGNRPVMADIEGWRCGLSICYDLRFPELFRYYSSKGVHLFFVPANFTQKTGKDHWEVLLRARAIENQAFVIAPDQCGANPKTGIASYGNSMIVGPWGEVLARAGNKECVLTVTLDPQDLRRTRGRIPALQHRRL
jgi:predicted amidohydrolase